MEFAELEKMVSVVDDDSVGEFLAKNELVIIVAGALWCSDTKRMIYKSLPILCEKYQGKVSFAMCMIEGETSGITDCPKFKKTYQVERYPTIIVFRNGQATKFIISEKSAEGQMTDMEELISEVINS